MMIRRFVDRVALLMCAVAIATALLWIVWHGAVLSITEGVVLVAMIVWRVLARRTSLTPVASSGGGLPRMVTPGVPVTGRTRIRSNRDRPVQPHPPVSTPPPGVGPSSYGLH